MSHSIVVNGQNVSLIPSGKSSAGKDISKAEIVFPNGDKIFISQYSSGASEPVSIKPSEEQLRQAFEAAKAENTKLKGKAKKSPKTSDGFIDTYTRTVVKDDASDLKEQVASMARMLQVLSAKLA